MTGDSESSSFLVTGASGQVGYEVARELAVLGRVSTPSRAEMDLSNPDSIRAAVRAISPRAIVNAAAYTAVDMAENDVEVSTAINGVAPRVLAEEAHALGIPLIHFSTDYVFDGRKSGSYCETDVPAPLGAYGRSKLMGEDGVREIGGAWLILRCSWVYSLRGKNFLRTIQRLAREKSEVPVVNDQSGSPTWARMIAAATASILTLGIHSPSGLHDFIASRAGIFHLTGPGRATWFDFARAIGSMTPDAQSAFRPIPTSAYPTLASRPANSLMDSRKIGDTFGVFLPPWRTQLELCLTP